FGHRLLRIALGVDAASRTSGQIWSIGSIGVPICEVSVLQRCPQPACMVSLDSMKTISYVLYREAEFIVAQYLNVEVSSFGATREEAVASLKEAVELYFEGESGNDFTPVTLSITRPCRVAAGS